MDRSRIATIAGLLLAAANGGSALAASFAVNSNQDLPDIAPGDGACNAFPPGPPPLCTLRAAIDEANATLGIDTVLVPAITIELTSDLPSILQPLEILGAGPWSTEIDGAGQHTIFIVGGGAEVSIERLIARNGSPTLATGGALYAHGGAHVGLDRVRLIGNTASSGGAIAVINATVTVSSSDLVLNEATVGDGAAIRVSGTGRVEISRSSIRRSRSASSTAEAIYVGSGAELIVENSLIDGEENGPGATERGGIRAISPEALVLRNVTMANFTRRGLLVDATGTSPGAIIAENSIFAGAAQDDCLIENIAPSQVAFSYNLVEDGSCAGFGGFGALTNLAGMDPQLGAVTFDTGHVPSYRLPAQESPVVDAGNPSQAASSACLPSDSRGIARPLDGDADGIARCDIGAVERATLTSSSFVVNVDELDLVDTNPGDGICGTILGDGQCTLRAAVMEANAKPGPDVISFDLDHAPSFPGGYITLTIPGSGGAEEGDLDITEALTIEGPPGTTGAGLPFMAVNQSVAGERQFEVLTAQPVVIRNLAMVGAGTAVSTSGGGLRIAGGGPVSLEHVRVSDRQSSAAGGAVSVVDGSLSVFDADFIGNSADERGAALFVGANGEAVVRSSSFRYNTISDPATTVRDTIHVEPGGSLLLENSTVAFNDGGVYAPGQGSVAITQSTLAFNEDRALHFVFGAGVDSLVVRSSIFAGNGIEDCLVPAVSIGASDVLSLDHHNLDESGSDCSAGATNQVASPGLVMPPSQGGIVQLPRGPGRLARYLEPLHEAGFDSPVLDAVPLGPDCLPEDIVGTARPQQLPGQPDSPGPCDIGAFEVLAAPLPDAIFADGFEP